MIISLWPAIILSGESLYFPSKMSSVLGAMAFPAQFAPDRILTGPPVVICLLNTPGCSFISQYTVLQWPDMNQIILSFIYRVPVPVSSQGRYTSQLLSFARPLPAV